MAKNKENWFKVNCDLSDGRCLTLAYYQLSVKLVVAEKFGKNNLITLKPSKHTILIANKCVFGLSENNDYIQLEMNSKFVFNNPSLFIRQI